ncbi:MAG: ankyrin repeat domain-containing protein, partial [archaeon]|nr:ankyrin repeat domain-containing protein [archaeon]
VKNEFADSAESFYFFSTLQLPQQIHEILIRSQFDSIEEVMRRLMDPGNGLQLKDRKTGFKKVKDCFIAQEMTAWIMNQLQTHNRDEAIAFCSYLERSGWIRAPGKAQPFTDKVVPFQFVRTLESVPRTPSASASSSVSVSVSDSPSRTMSQFSDLGRPPRDSQQRSSGMESDPLSIPAPEAPTGLGSSPHLVVPPEPAPATPGSFIRGHASRDHLTPRTNCEDALIGARPLRTTPSELSPESTPKSADNSTDQESSSQTLDGDLVRTSSLSMPNSRSSEILETPVPEPATPSQLGPSEDSFHDVPESSTSRDNPFSEFIRTEKQCAHEISSFLEQLEELKESLSPSDFQTLRANFPEMLSFHQDLVASLEQLPWSDSFSKDSDVHARKMRNHINPLDIAKVSKNDMAEPIPEEVDRDRRAIHPGEHQSPLHLAASSGDLIALLTAIEEHPHLVAHSDTRLWTPLHIACASGQIAMVHGLLEAGAKANAQTNEKALPLHLFVRNSYTPNKLWRSVLRRLTETVDINHQTITGETAVHFAAFGEDTEDNLRWLVRHGADLNRLNLRANSALHNSIQQGRARVVRFLLCQGADLNQTAGSMTPLQLAKGKPATSTLLLSWHSVFSWWIAIQRIIRTAIRQLKRLHRIVLSFHTRISETLAAVSLSITLPKGFAECTTLMSNHMARQILALQASWNHPSQNPHVVYEVGVAIQRLQTFQELFSTHQQLPCHRRSLLELSLSFPSHQIQSVHFFHPANLLERTDKLLFITPFTFSHVPSSPAVALLKTDKETRADLFARISGPSDSSETASSLPVIAFLFDKLLVLAKEIDRSRRALLFWIELSKIVVDRDTDPHPSGMLITVLRLHPKDPQSRFRLSSETEEDVQNWIQHTPRSSSKATIATTIQL